MTFSSVSPTRQPHEGSIIMARFTETDQAAQLLQQILALPSTGGAAPSSDRPDAQGSAYTPNRVEADPDPVWTVPPPLPSAGAVQSVVREVVKTRAGEVELKLYVASQAATHEVLDFDGETVAGFFQRVVRPLSSADPSAG